MRVGMNCVFCGNVHYVDVNEDNYAMWVKGALIQKAMPELTATEREQLISHICPRCQESVFGVEEDDFDFIEEQAEDDLAEEEHYSWLSEFQDTLKTEGNPEQKKNTQQPV